MARPTSPTWPWWWRRWWPSRLYCSAGPSNRDGGSSSLPAMQQAGENERVIPRVLHQLQEVELFKPGRHKAPPASRTVAGSPPPQPTLPSELRPQTHPSRLKSRYGLRESTPSSTVEVTTPECCPNPG